jgi:serine phosphatase RsbU (regulator of sigma subunit)
LRAATPFLNHVLKIHKGDQIYLFSDGYPDQFGGEKGKKFKYKPFKKLLLANANRPMKEQYNILEQTLNNWQRGYEQVDDILVIGIRI